MNKILFLDDLVEINDAKSDFGLKASGLAKLKKIFTKTNMPSYVSIPNIFAVPISFDLNDFQLKDAYAKLIYSFNEPRIILARSSDPTEKPGKFETHPSLYDPNNKAQSFENWINAARKVRASGANALIGQPLVGKLEEFSIDWDWDYDNNSQVIKEEFTKLCSFGGENTSFFLNSSNFLTGINPHLVACFGLPSKIARGDNDVCLMEENKYGLKIVNLNHNYRVDSFGKFSQNTIDIITLSEPQKITTLPYPKQCWSGRLSNYGHSTIPIRDFYRFNSLYPAFKDHDFSPEIIFEILNIIKSEVDNHIELEGCVNNDGVFLFQLREYELPHKNLDRLTKISNERILLKPKNRSLGFNQFIGNLYLSSELIDIPKKDILLYYGDIHKQHDLNPFRKYSQLIIPFFESEGWYEAAHSFAQTVQTLVDLEKIEVKPIALGQGSLTELFFKNASLPESRFQKLDNSTFLYKNVTAECTGFDAQIFFNN